MQQYGVIYIFFYDDWLQVEIQAAVGKVCSLLPAPLQYDCAVFMAKYSSDITNLLVDNVAPGRVCSMDGLKVCIRGVYNSWHPSALHIIVTNIRIILYKCFYDKTSFFHCHYKFNINTVLGIGDVLQDMMTSVWQEMTFQCCSHRHFTLQHPFIVCTECFCNQ